MLKLSPTDALIWFRKQCPGPARIYAPGCSGEVEVFARAFAENPALAAHLTFLGIWIPGINRTDYAGLHPSSRSELIFLSSDFRESFEAGRAKLRPLSYTQSWPWLETTPLDAAFIHVSPPDKDGLCSLGLSADFTPAVMNRPEILKIAHINPAMPVTSAAPKIAYETFDVVVDNPAPVLAYKTAPLPAVFSAIADNIATLIDDGACLQFGLGNVQLAVLRALNKKKQLRIHSGMISDPVLEAIKAGVFSDDEGAITTGVALGTTALYHHVANNPHIQFSPVQFTHALRTLAAISKFTAINSVIEVDLFGQANAEYMGTRQISGTGGLVDFLRGAAHAPDGKPILALSSTAKSGTVSRIVPKLRSPSVSVNRSDTGLVVTEFGVADLRGLPLEERAHAMIAIAHPDHQPDLRKAWSGLQEEL